MIRYHLCTATPSHLVRNLRWCDEWLRSRPAENTIKFCGCQDRAQRVRGDRCSRKLFRIHRRSGNLGFSSNKSRRLIVVHAFMPIGACSAGSPLACVRSCQCAACARAHVCVSGHLFASRALREASELARRRRRAMDASCSLPMHAACVWWNGHRQLCSRFPDDASFACTSAYAHISEP